MIFQAENKSIISYTVLYSVNSINNITLALSNHQIKSKYLLHIHIYNVTYNTTLVHGQSSKITNTKRKIEVMNSLN